MFLTVTALVSAAQAQKFTVLHTFHLGKGPYGPSGKLTQDAEGNLYGVAGGGTGTCFSNTPCGTVYKMTTAGQLVWVYSFEGPGTDGNEPTTGLLRDAKGNLFGVTLYGGVNTKTCSDNVQRICGVVYELDHTGKKETVLHRFAGGSGGSVSEVVPIQDSSGKLYGTTIWGGDQNDGVVYEVDQAGKFSLLYDFQGGADGGTDSAFIWGLNGNLYGVANDGANAAGVVFELDRTGKETVLYNFTGGSDGSTPDSLIADAAGNLYGTTAYGGNLIDICDENEGCGVVFKLSPNSNGTWTETVLYTFCSQSNCTDGHRPFGPLLRDSAGNLYGPTVMGGGSHNCNGSDCGIVFKLDTTGKETVLHAFTDGPDGAFPDALVMDGSNNLYGVANQGGDDNCHLNGIPGCGVMFKITP
jgi:uncharacterized repeat protein (TIGR03803 family)